MSVEDVELVRRAFYPSDTTDLVSRFADRDALAARLEPYLHPDFEVLDHELAPPGFESGKGARRYVDFYAEWLSAWASFHVAPVEFHDLGDRVVSIVRMTGATVTHGAEVEQKSAVIFGIEHGLVRFVKFFMHADDACREAGLES